ncbi:T-cell-specific surface glycoprotein CD28 [Nematolebias whitei]|uniref:T-cell-specific surface glycoprotein CD28 n=1 Tax=Nematolebias whitei TaxID=451745 RepID=UPI001899BAF7|nr:T-cell-specific surface glycoprotein CD28 [Nematolebias whitei]
MGVCWMLMILLSCMSSCASLHRSPRGNEGEQLQILYLNAHSRQPVFVPCPNVTGEDVTFQLFKNQNILCQLGTKNQNQCNQTQINAQPCKNELNQVVGFNITGPAAARSKAIFRCEAKIMFPPPFLLLQSDQWVLILTEEDLCLSNKDESNGSDSEERKSLFWIWITAVSLLGTYSLAITAVALVIWVRSKGAENQNDYMNTKPKAPRKRKKKKGVQTPIPRYF